MGVMKSVGVDDETIQRFVDNVFLNLVRFDAFLHTQPHPARFTVGRMTVMLYVEFELDILHGELAHVFETGY
jgi:hypothetical protein